MEDIGQKTRHISFIAGEMLKISPMSISTSVVLSLLRKSRELRNDLVDYGDWIGYLKIYL